MKYNLFKVKENERIDIYYKENNKLIKDIVDLIENSNSINVKDNNKDIHIFNFNDISCFISLNNKTYAIINNKEYEIKYRLYEIEELYKDNVIKLNKSCIANINKISRLKVTLDASIKVIFKDGYEDYISRRELKNVKRRLNLL